MPAAVIHIGTAKTGTTQIQRFLAANADVLARHEVNYPQFLRQENHSKLVVASTDHPTSLSRTIGIATKRDLTRFQADLAADFRRRIDTDDSGRWLFSSEFLSSRLKSPVAVAGFRRWMDQWFDDCEIIVYLRRQDYWAPSAYSTYVKAGGTATWGLNELTGPYFDLTGIVRRWQEAFGVERVTVRPYLEGGHHRRSDVLDDFIAALALPADDTWIRPGQPANQRLNRTATELLRLLNQDFDRADGHLRVNRRGLIPRLEQLTGEGSWQFPTELMEAVVNHYRADNEQLVAQFGPGDPRWHGWLEQERSGSLGPEPELTAAEATTIISRLVAERLIGVASRRGPRALPRRLRSRFLGR